MICEDARRIHSSDTPPPAPDALAFGQKHAAYSMGAKAALIFFLIAFVASILVYTKSLPPTHGNPSDGIAGMVIGALACGIALGCVVALARARELANRHLEYKERWSYKIRDFADEIQGIDPPNPAQIAEFGRQYGSLRWLTTVLFIIFVICAISGISGAIIKPIQNMHYPIALAVSGVALISSAYLGKKLDESKRVVNAKLGLSEFFVSDIYDMIWRRC